MEALFNAGWKDYANLWAAAQVKLEAEGVMATVGQIMNKWNQLKRRYREIKDHNTGNDRKTYKHEEALDNIFGERAATNPSYTIRYDRFRYDRFSSL